MVSAVAFLVIQPQVPNVRLIGRFLSDQKGGYSCEWPGSAVQFYARGSLVTVHFKASTPNDRWQVDIDGTATEVLKLDPAQENYDVSMPDLKRHLVTLVRRTECFSGETLWKGADNGAMPLPQPPGRSIQIVGDSISAGFGVDGKTKEDAYSFDTANAYMTYGSIAARALKADCTIIAWSGRKMWPNNTIPEIYDFALPNASRGQSQFLDRSFTDAVLVNLATNDFGAGVPDKAKWTAAYTGFVRKLRTRFPNAHIYLATGSMMSDNWPPKENHLTTLKGYLDSVKSSIFDKKIHRIDFAVQDEKDGIGSQWHPNAATQGKMAKVLVEALRNDLGWK
jgi:GDSL-like Lipase/Acylhydrolase family/Carbohydrate esterase 2 N-terminal